MYTNWSAGGQRSSMYELCTFITEGGWQEHNCSGVKQSVCFNGGYNIKVDKTFRSLNLHRMKMSVSKTADLLECSY